MFEEARIEEGQSEFPAFLKLVPAAASTLTIWIAVCALGGWAFDIDVLKRFGPGLIAMNPTTAVLLIIGAVALAISIRPPGSKAWSRLATGLSVVVLLAGLVKLIGIAANWHWNFDEWLFASKLSAEFEMPNRVAPNSAVSFVFVGLSLLTLDVSAVRFSPSQSFAILAGFCPLLTLTGYIYGVRIFREPLSPFISQAVSTAFTFLILTAGIFFARPSAPLSQLFVSREPRGVMARRLFPLAVLLTLILGWLCVLGERHNVFGDAFGTALLAITLSALFIVVVSWTVWTVSKLELERAANVKKRAALELQLQREEMAHYNRVLLIGEMTASIVHELNQPLTAISINTSAARRLIEHGKAGPSLVETLSDIAADATRAVEVIQNVRSLVHKGEGIRMPLNLNSVIIDSVRITKQDVISHASILTTELDPELPEVDGDAVQIQQVLLNLIANALEAMGGIAPSERRIVIRTRLGNEHMVELIVRDHGSGLPKDNPGKIFDHFYSTKQRGMGMGLSIVQSIVEAHAGTIKAENAPDHGARIVIRLPAVKTGVVEKSGQLIEDNAFHLRSPKDFP